jgi:hypothetical protein
MRYAKQEDGTVIDGNRAGEIQKFARSIWVSFAKKGPPPPKWGKLTSRCGRYTAMRWAVDFQNSSFVNWTGKPTRSPLTAIHHGM